MPKPVHIAAWSGPRNVSTALMRSWGNRDDTFVCDEPFYAHYLLEHGLDHPGREEVFAHHETDVAKIITWLTGPIPESKAIFYQKHMAHHLLPEMDRSWTHRLSHLFLIREPREMLTSLLQVLPTAELEDTGLPQQLELFEDVVERTGTAPPVIDARDLLLDPPKVLAKLCEQLGVAFEDTMLSWPPGRRATDGAWAPHWYSAVEASTSFTPYRKKKARLPDHRQELLEACLPFYEALCEHRLH